MDGEMELDPDTQFGEESKNINLLSALSNIRNCELDFMDSTPLLIHS